MRSHSGLKARPETELRAGPCALGGDTCFDGAVIDVETSFKRHLLAG